MLISEEIKKKLSGSNKQINDILLIEKYFQDKYGIEADLDNDQFLFHKREVLEFVENYCADDYPLQYLVGFEYFGKIKIIVNKNVLIPRMETEEVVWEFVKKIKENYPRGSTIRIADICTGSGCILVLLNKMLREDYELVLYASDISNEALQVAQENFKENNMSVETYEGHLIEPLRRNGIVVDCVISNPPYIPRSDEIADNVEKYEPHLALFAEENGLIHYNEIMDKIDTVIEEGLLCFEVGHNQGAELRRYGSNLKFIKKTDIINDMNNKDRIALMELGW